MFENIVEDWPVWSNMLMRYVETSYRGAEAVLDWVMEQQNEVTRDQMQMTFGHLVPDLDGLSRDLYAVLTYEIDGYSLNLVKDTPMNNNCRRPVLLHPPRTMPL